MNKNSILSEKIHKLLNRETANVDTYYHNESMWLIFTDSKKWVIELTKEGTLWYNYYFFENSFKFFNLDVVENQHHVTKWVESIIQNGVKSTQVQSTKWPIAVESIIQNGVKHTYKIKMECLDLAESIIQNGIKETNHVDIMKFFDNKMDNVLQNVVKHTEYGDCQDGDERFNDIIQNGIKETYDDVYHHNGRVEGVIKNGIKETNWRKVDNFPDYENRVIENGNLIKKD